MGEWDIPQPVADAPTGLEEPDYSRTESTKTEHSMNMASPDMLFRLDSSLRSQRNAM